MFRSAHSDLTMRLLRDAERDAQRIAGGLRLLIGGLLLTVASVARPDTLLVSPLPLLTVLLYFAIGLASIGVTHRRLFSTYWAPVFVVLDVLWYYATLVVELLTFRVPPNEFVSMPVFGVLFILIALAGMRYTPWALLAGVATFAVLDVSFYLYVTSGHWPGEPVSDDARFGFGLNVFRIAAVMATGAVVGITSLRARQSLVRAFETGVERDAVRTLFGRYLPESVAADMVAAGGALPPRSGTATIMVIDIQGFSTLAEDRHPRALVDLMNAFFARAEDVIRTHDGVVAQFQGDGLLATFNLPLARDDHADRALAAAAAILTLVDRERFGGEALQVRIGIATGAASAGAVGGRDRLSYTVYGDVVNVASRLEQANKQTQTRVLIAGSTAAGCVAAPTLKHLGALEVRGRHGMVDVCTFADDNPSVTAGGQAAGSDT